MDLNNNDGILRVGRVFNQQGQQVIFNGLGQWRCCVCGHRAGYADCVEHVFHVHVSEISREEQVKARLLADQRIKTKEQGVIVHYRGIHWKSRGMFECGLCEKAWSFRAGTQHISNFASMPTKLTNRVRKLENVPPLRLMGSLIAARLSPNVTARVSKDNRISKPLNNHRSQSRQQQLPVSRIQTTQISRDCVGNALQHQLDSPQPWPFPFSPHTINSNFSQPATPSDSLPTSLASTSRFSRRHEESGIHSSYGQLATYPFLERIPFSPLPQPESSSCSANPHSRQHRLDFHPPPLSSSSIPSTPAWNYRPMSRQNSVTTLSPNFFTSLPVTTPERYQPPPPQVWEMPELPGPYSY
ncbi:hypothetical protein JCM5350_003193 [Sporobolomyces pararoseus]